MKLGMQIGLGPGHIALDGDPASIEDTDWGFLPEFHADLSRYKEMQVHCTRYKQETHQEMR